jgi:hypothetical protein
MALSFFAACGGNNEEGAETAAHTHDDEPIQMIPDDDWNEFAEAANAHLNPYFDAEGTVTEKAVAPGDYFDMYIVAEYSEDYPMNAAGYQLHVPEGVTILSSKNCDSTIVVVGEPLHDFVMGFRCTKGPKMWLVQYQCRVNDEFTGGEITTTAGHDFKFLGFTLCDEDKTMIPAKSGTAMLTKK